MLLHSHKHNLKNKFDYLGLQVKSKYFMYYIYYTGIAFLAIFIWGVIWHWKMTNLSIPVMDTPLKNK